MSELAATVDAEELRVAPLELFFDLVFVFAITQIAGLIRSELPVPGVLRGALILAMIYWGCSLFTLALNNVGTVRLDDRLHPRSPPPGWRAGAVRGRR